MCVCERERERESVCVCVREREKARESLCVVVYLLDLLAYKFSTVVYHAVEKRVCLSVIASRRINFVYL